MGVRAIDRGVKGCIYLNGTQRAENERGDGFPRPNRDARCRCPRERAYAPQELPNSRRELRAGAANLLRPPGLKRQDNDLIAIKSAESAPRRPRHSSAISRPDLAAMKFYPPA